MNKEINGQILRLPENRSSNLLQRWAALLVLASFGGLVPFSASAAVVTHGIAAGMINVAEYPGWDPNVPGADNNTNVIATLVYSINDFRLLTYNRADLNTQIGSSSSDDIAGGIMISCVSQNGQRNSWGIGGTNLCATPSWHPNANSYRLCSSACVAGGGGSGYEYNYNVAGAWFPYSQYIGGWARNVGGANGGSNDLFTGSAGLVLGTHVRPLYDTNNATPTRGKTILDLTSLGIDARTDGIVLVNHPKEEGNFALSMVNQTNGTWLLFVKDNAADAGANAYEQDPISFVYIPRTNTSLVSGKFLGNGTITMFSGDSPQFTVTSQGGGRWDLRMNNYTPTNGILMISPEGGLSQNQDNIVSYEIQPDGSGWQIQSRDLPNAGLQTPNSGLDPIISFVFIPAPTPGFTVTPTNNLLTTESAGTANFTVVLHAPPTNTVSIDVASDNAAEGTASPSTLSFTTGNWNIPQMVTITGQDDGVKDGSVPYSIVLSPATSGDTRYNGLNPPDVSVVNADNEPGITINKSLVTTTEGPGPDSFTVVLTTPPTGDVTIGLSSSDTTEGTVAPASVTFTSLNWSDAQTVTITGVNDDVDDGNIAYTIVTGAATSTDVDYNGVNPADVAAINVDDDTRGIVFSPANGLSVNESGSSTNFTVVLTSEPTANVTVNLAAADATEGSVTPASRTFTPANWSIPQSFTLTGVDDFVNDGTIAYNVTGTVTSTDPLYAALVPTTLANTVDNEAAISLPLGTITYAAGEPGLGIDGQATITDPDTADYSGGSLTISLTANGTSDDRLEVRNTGNGAGEIGVSGGTVSYGGTAIGTFSGGTGTTPLVISFNSSANAVAAQALLRNITFRNVNSAPSLNTRTVQVALADGDGGTSTAGKNIIIGLLHVADFQQGTDSGFGVYTNAADAELNGSSTGGTSPGTAYPAGSNPTNGILVAWVGGIQNVNALLRFDNIIGNGPGQIPSNAIIVSADLFLNLTVSGDGSPLHRMLIPWDAETDTWDSKVNGIDLDDAEARSTYESQIGITNVSSGNTTVGNVSVSVLPDVQAWANGEANYGWVLPGWPFNATATSFSPSESANVSARPRLRVKWLASGTPGISFRQGIDGYTGTKDVRIREAAPDADLSLDGILFVDAEANAGENDPDQSLLRFENIIGNLPGQIPPGSMIHAAVLDLASVSNDAMGDGGTIHPMLTPWQDTDTWNSLVSGVVADGVEAAVAPTGSAGSPTLNPDVQGGYHTFEVTSDVQAWANASRPNYGWVFLPWPLGGNGWGFASSEFGTESERPRLRVYYTAGAGSNIQLLTPVWSPSTVQVRFTATVGNTYSILRAPDVTGPWTTNGSATVQPNGIGTFNDNAPLSGKAFYRVQSP